MEYLLSKTIRYIAEAMPELLLVDEDYGQLENLDQSNKDMYPLVYPAVLIEPSEVSWSELKGDSQIGEATLRTRLIIDCYDDHHAGSGSEYRILEREELRQKLHKLLQGFRPLDDGAFVRSASTFYTFNHGIKVYETIYKCRVTERLAKGTMSSQTRPHISISTEHHAQPLS